MSSTGGKIQSSRLTGWPWLVLVVVGAVETLISLSDLSVLFDDAPDVPGTTPGGLLITATLILNPLFAAASVALAFKGRIDRAIVALAGVALLTWLSDLPWVVAHWPDHDLAMPESLLNIVLLPLAAATAINLGWRKKALRLATVLAVLPTIAKVLGVVAFTISVIVYGF